MAGRRERKVVTVLFADLVGFTSRAEQIDPEDVDAELTRYHTRVRGELERHGGTVEKFIGDAAMAVFGAPVAHEDDPERAVRAALAVRDWAREEGELEVRIGVNTGEALVRLDAQPGAGEGMAAGDVVNTASRLQAAAPIDGILVGEATFRATRQSIAYGEPRLSRRRERRSRSRRGRRSSRGLASGSSGCTERRSSAAAASSRCSPARSTAHAGSLGAARHARRRPGDRQEPPRLRAVPDSRVGPRAVLWRQGRCLPYGDGVTLLGARRDRQGRGRDPRERRGRGGRAQAREAADDPRRAERSGRAHCGRSSASAEASGRRPSAPRPSPLGDGSSKASRNERPLVLVFEDLHWADGDAPRLRRPPGRLGAWRPDPGRLHGTPRAPRPAARLGRRQAERADDLALAACPTRTRPVWSASCSRSRARAPRGRQLLARAGGNPLYAEQYARILRERGRLVELPETVQGIIAARLDLLDLEHKACSRTPPCSAGCSGQAGSPPSPISTRRTVEDVLHSLERADFVRRERRTAVAEETQYTFLHVLARDVAYGQIPRADRVDKHRRAAEWIESLGRREDHAEMLAYHYVQALELAEAARLDTADIAGPARLALRDAGDRAAALYSAAAAERFYEAALRLWPDDDPERVELLYRRAIPAGRHVGGGDPDRLAEARDALLAVGDNDRAAEMEALLAQAFWIQGKRELSDEHRRNAAALLGDGARTKSRAWVLGFLARSAFLRGELERAVELATEGIATSEALDWEEGISDPLTLLGMIRVHRGDAGGIQDVERGIEIASASGSLAVLARVVNVLAVCYQVLGDLESGYRVRLEGAQVAERLGFEPLTRWFAATLVDHHYRRGEWEEAERSVDEFIALVEAGSPHVLTWQIFAVRAELRLARGRRATRSPMRRRRSRPRGPSARSSRSTTRSRCLRMSSPWPRTVTGRSRLHTSSSTR